MRRPSLPALFILVGACAARPEVGSETLRGSTTVPVRSELEVLASPIVGEAPSDAPVRVTLRLRGSEGRERALAGTWIGAVPWDGAAAALAPDRTLSRVDLDGEQLLGHDVTALPVVSRDGAHLAYTASEDGLSGALHVVDALGDRVVATGLSSIGALVFSPDGARVAFVGAAQSGIAGVWVADARAAEPARCLTNCALEPGDDLTNAVPLPVSALVVTHQAIRWTDASGATHEVTP